MSQFVKAYKQTHLDNRIPAYDGNKSLYTAGPLPFTSKEFDLKFVEDDSGPAREREFKITIKLAAKISTHNLKEFLAARQSEIPQDAIQVLDVVMQAAAPANYVVIGRSFFSSNEKGDLGPGLEYWRGYYQSLRPTQMGLSLNVDVSARPFYEPIFVHEFISKFLGLRDLSRPLLDRDRVKIKKALRGITVETTYRGFTKKHKISNLSLERADQMMFDGADGSKTSVYQYFWDKYKYDLIYPNLPCIITGQGNRAVHIPMEVCKLIAGERYAKKLNEVQVTKMLRATCQRPLEREQNIKQIIANNRYNQNEVVAKQFGMQVNQELTSIDSRVLPVPKLQYHKSGRDSMVSPAMGQWNMIGKKMYHGGKVDFWTCVNFSNYTNFDTAARFCTGLVDMCMSRGMAFNQKPLFPFSSSPPTEIEKALGDIASQASEENKQLQLLIIILPDNSGLYGKIKRVCETELGIVSQCCQPKQVHKLDKQYLENVSLKINVKVGGRNTVLYDAISQNIPCLTDRPTIIFGADVTHAQPGEDSTPSIAAVVASMDWPEVTKYRGLVSAQGPREEIIKDMYNETVDSKKGLVSGGMVRELLVAFRKSTGRKPDRIIFYRDGVSEGQFAQVLLHEVDAIRKACLSLESGYLPRITFVVVQKRHHTRLFAADPSMADRSGNIIPGTVVDTKICHPNQFDFYLCSHAGIQGTSRPTHYHVLHDENFFTADLLQLLTNSLCYTYARCTKSVSVVPPAYYAHLLAFRARYYMEPDTSDGGSTGAGSGQTSTPVRPVPKIKGNVTDVMFYC